MNVAERKDVYLASKPRYEILDGLLISRMGKLIKVRGGFWWCSLFIEISTPQSNYGMKGSLALFNNPVMHLTPDQQKVCALDFDYIDPCTP